MGGRIDCYIDVASMYSYFAFIHLFANQELLASHGVELNFHPVLIAGINAGSGNKPPWTLPRKADYLYHDGRRSAALAGKPEVKAPPNFLSMSMTVLPMRAMHYIKQKYPKKTYESVFYYLFRSFWEPPHQNLTDADVLARVLSDAPRGFDGNEIEKSAERCFSEEDAKKIMEGACTTEMKNLLKATTQEALDRGAFGAPWLWVTNSAGTDEPFFGSDRFHFVYEFLDLPYQNVKLLPPGSGRGKTDLKL